MKMSNLTLKLKTLKIELGEMLILSEYWTPKTVVNNPSEFNINRKVESKPKEINIPCLKNKKK